MSTRLVHLALGALALAFLATTSARAGDTEPGVYWEQTVEMHMQGMNMPPQTQKVCVAKAGMEEPPKPGPGKDKDCEITDVQKVGPKMTWKMKCTGAQAMTGEGEIVQQGKDSYAGQMAMHMPQGEITMKMSGKKVGGDCDAAAVKKQVAAAQKQAKQVQEDGEVQMAKLCDKAIDEVDIRMFGGGPVVTCKKPEQVAKLCGFVVTRAGYTAYQKTVHRDDDTPRIVKGLCKKNPETALPGLCAKAAKETSGDKTPDDLLNFLGTNCPDEVRTFAKKECAGRDFSGVHGQMANLCVKYAREEMAKPKARNASEDDEGDDDQPKRSRKQDAAEGAKKLLKGLF
jgi:hypothetical protein